MYRRFWILCIPEQTLVEQRRGLQNPFLKLVQCSHLSSLFSRVLCWIVLRSSFSLLSSTDIAMEAVEAKSQKLVTTPEVQAKDIPDAVNHSDKLEEEFQKAVEEAKEVPDSIDHMDKLALYGLFKTATVGKCNIADPGMLNITANAKYRAWKLFEGKSKDEAKAEYITKIAQIREDM